MDPEVRMSACRSGFLLLLLMLAVPPSVAAQSQQAPPPVVPGQPPYTLQVNTRVVLTDVTVTDAKGNPVRGLREADFNVFDNRKPQKLASFEEHTAELTPAGAFSQAGANVYSNDYVAHPPPVVNVLLIDTTTIPLVDQMYLYEQLTRFVRDLPPGAPMAVFLRSGAMMLPLQSFTTNKELLMTAIREAVPHFRMPGYWYRTSEETLWQLASYLSQVPGRKNILWFSEGSNLFLSPDPMATPMPRRPLYDMLEKRRIALYPIDARGLTVAFSRAMAMQHILMAQDADSTGGHAYYNDNELAAIAQEVLNTDGDYYTLTYAPDDLRQDGKWHKVTVKVGEDKRLYHLSYRRGYYDDRRNDERPEPPMRTLLRKDGSTVQVPNDRNRPIVFQATVSPAGEELPAYIPTLSRRDTPLNFRLVKPLKKGETAYRIHYIVPARDIVPESVKGNTGTDVIGVAILAVDRFGKPIKRIAQRTTLAVDEAKAHANPNAAVAFDQQINLPLGQDYLDVGLWDMTTGRVGMLTVPIAVTKPKTR
jgi:VWFA-related protein